MSTQKKVWFHVMFWVFKISVTTYMYKMDEYVEGDLPLFVLQSTIEWLATFIWFYANYLLMVPRLLVKGRYLLYGLAVLLCVYFNFISKAYVWDVFEPANFWWPRSGIRTPILYNTVMYLFASTALGMVGAWLTSERKKHELTKEIKIAELLLLNSQINPHFLFNTLNNVYGLSIADHANTSKAIGQLKTLISSCDSYKDKETINIQEEITYIENLINLNALRSAIQVNFDKQIIDTTWDIPPMLLLPFVENAFKHGTVIQDDRIDIQLTTGETALDFRIVNQKSPAKRKDEIGGIGIDNVKKRLSLYYPTAHQLDIIDTEHTFIVHLIIKRNE